MKILSRTGRVLYESSDITLRATVIAALSSRTDLHDADFRYADLPNADLRGADFRYADFREADLLGVNW
jgi:uncharacterized protein YjbI with pentapeptide repeats